MLRLCVVLFPTFFFLLFFEVQREQREENEVSMNEMSVMNEQESWNAYVQKLSNVQKILRAKRF